MRSLVAAAALLLVACSDDDVTTTAAPTTVPATTAPETAIVAATSVPRTPPPSTSALAPSPATSLAAEAVVPQGFQQVAATATMPDGTVCELCLWLAATADQRALGLMYATDLGGPDGMVFHYDSPTSAAFWMKDTVMPLSIAFYDGDGAYLDAFDMAPCSADPCPTYPTPPDFVDAIEVPQGMLDELGLVPGSVLHVSDTACLP
jgi:uncharacterized membrane protein (UPF0127 family)